MTPPSGSATTLEMLNCEWFESNSPVMTSPPTPKLGSSSPAVIRVRLSKTSNSSRRGRLLLPHRRGGFPIDVRVKADFQERNQEENVIVRAFQVRCGLLVHGADIPRGAQTERRGDGGPVRVCLRWTRTGPLCSNCRRSDSVRLRLPFSSADCLTPSRLLDCQSFAVASARYYFWNVSEPSPCHE